MSSKTSPGILQVFSRTFQGCLQVLFKISPGHSRILEDFSLIQEFSRTLWALATISRKPSGIFTRIYRAYLKDLQKCSSFRNLPVFLQYSLQYVCTSRVLLVFLHRTIRNPPKVFLFCSVTVLLGRFNNFLLFPKGYQRNFVAFLQTRFPLCSAVCLFPRCYSMHYHGSLDGLLVFINNFSGKLLEYTEV